MSAERRILYQLIAPMEATLGVSEIERRRAFLQDHAAPGIRIEVRSVARGKASIESEYDAALVVGGARAAQHIRGMGLASRHASTRGVGLSVLDLARDDGAALDRIASVGRACVEEDGADVLVFGCMSMAFLGLHMAIEARLGVPVVNPVIAALKTAETLLAHGLTHSRRAWPSPPEKPTYDRNTTAWKVLRR